MTEVAPAESLLDLVRVAPGRFLQSRTIYHLEAYLHGRDAAGDPFWRYVPATTLDVLHSKYVLPDDAGWASALALIAGSASAAFDAFFELRKELMLRDGADAAVPPCLLPITDRVALQRFVDHLRRRPGLVVRGRSVRLLRSFLNGFVDAQEAAKTNLLSLRFPLANFGRWLAQTHGLPSDLGADWDVILAVVASARREAGTDVFCEQFARFLEDPSVHDDFAAPLGESTRATTKSPGFWSRSTRAHSLASSVAPAWSSLGRLRRRSVVHLAAYLRGRALANGADIDTVERCLGTKLCAAFRLPDMGAPWPDILTLVAGSEEAAVDALFRLIEEPTHGPTEVRAALESIAFSSIAPQERSMPLRGLLARLRRKPDIVAPRASASVLCSFLTGFADATAPSPHATLLRPLLEAFWLWLAQREGLAHLPAIGWVSILDFRTSPGSERGTVDLFVSLFSQFLDVNDVP